MAISNSFSDVLNRMLAQSNNALSIYKGISNAVSGTSESVTITITDEAGEEQTIQVPSFGYLSNAISRLENTVSTLSNMGDGDGSTIRLSDGSYRKLLTSKIPSEAPSITVNGDVTNFKFKSNYFYEELINPLLYVTVDLSDSSNKIPVDTQRVQVQRYLIQGITDTQEWNTFISGIKNAGGDSTIKYKAFLSSVATKGYNYILDDEVVSLPPRTKRYTGSFTITDTNEEVVDGSKVTEYIFSDLRYTDNNTGSVKTRYLTINDEIEVVGDDNTVDTKYKVVAVDNSRNAVQLSCVEGFRPINSSSNIRISTESTDSISIDVPIGFDEYCVLFIKAIDHNSNIPASEWSNGIAFYSNNLSYVDGQGKTQTLATYYQKNVTDIGKMLLSYAQDFYPCIADAITPTAPTLSESDFNVVQINKQVTDTDSAESIQTLVAEKNSIEADLDRLSQLISATKTKIQTSKYINADAKKQDNDLLASYIAEQTTKSNEYSDVVNGIQNKYSVYGSHKDPKYRVRGFWKIPDAAVAPTGTQEIIKFKIRYRYLNSNGNANNIQEYTYVDDASANTEATAVFSNWVIDETILRSRVKDSTTGMWKWADIKNTDIDSVDINQLEIPINKGEQVEIQIKSVSEAGYPNNPAESDWSASVIIPFPEDLMYDTVEDIVNQNKQDLAKNALQKELTSMGVRGHVSDSFATNDKYFAHTATSIASGFLSEEQTPITLFDKLQDLENMVTMLRESIDQEMGEVSVKLIDSDGNETPLLEGTTTYIDAGYYKDDVEKLYTDEDDRKGAILNKVYNINISNSKRSGLYLLAKIGGNHVSMVPSTLNLDDKQKKYNGANVNDEDYRLYSSYSYYDNIINPTELGSEYIKSVGRYDLVPINVSNSPIIDFQVASPNMYQSAQCRGQFIYSRYRDLGDTYNLYASEKGNYGNYSVTYIDSLFNSSEVNGYDVNVTTNGTARTITFGDDLCICHRNKSGDNAYVISDGTITSIGLDEYNRLTASKVKDADITGDATVDQRKQMINTLMRVPRTFRHAPTGIGNSYNNKKIIERIDLIKSSSTAKQKLIDRIQKINGSDSNKYTIDPRIQSIYAFTDMDWRDAPTGTDIYDDHTYLTTHKIGFIDSDKLLKPTKSSTEVFNESTCNSYLFLSPISHENIQVDGEAVNATKHIAYGESNSINVPLIYQSRLTDADGNIFGNRSNDENSVVVANTYFSNIIGLDIWDNKEYPLQFDILVFSKYKNTDNTRSSAVTPSQQLSDAVKDIATNFDVLRSNSTSTGSKK